MPTKKKNEFIFTIKFDEKDPEHVRVTKLLNETDKKNQLIVSAILCYIDSGYMNVRPWNIYPAFGPPGAVITEHQIPDHKVLVDEDGLEEDDIDGIMQSLQAIRGL